MTATNQTQQQLDALKQRMEKYDDILEKLQESNMQTATAVTLLQEKMRNTLAWAMLALSVGTTIAGAIVGAVLSYLIMRQ